MFEWEKKDWTVFFTIVGFLLLIITLGFFGVREEIRIENRKVDVLEKLVDKNVPITITLNAEPKEEK